MKQGGDRRASSGFTIVEVLIVLAVTGVLFVAAAILINGRQNKTEFTTAINNLQQQLQQVINETQSGYFPSSDSFTCTPGISSQPTVTAASGSAQGQHNGCLFLGKVTQFIAGSDGDQMVVLPVAGNRNAAGGTPALDVKSTYPVAMSDTGFVSTQQLQYGLKAFSMTDSLGNNIGAFGVLTGSNDANGTFASASGGGLASGSQQMTLYSVATTQLGQDSAEASKVTATNLQAVNSVTICVQSGSTNQSGKFLIGGTNGLAVSLQIFGDTTC